MSYRNGMWEYMIEIVSKGRTLKALDEGFMNMRKAVQRARFLRPYYVGDEHLEVINSADEPVFDSRCKGCNGRIMGCDMCYATRSTLLALLRWQRRRKADDE